MKIMFTNEVLSASACRPENRLLKIETDRRRVSWPLSHPFGCRSTFPFAVGHTGTLPPAPVKTSCHLIAHTSRANHSRRTALRKRQLVVWTNIVCVSVCVKLYHTHICDFGK